MDELIQKILVNISKITNQTSFSEPFFEMVLNRLVSFNVQLKEDDSWMIAFAIQKVENHIKNSCNITEIPIGLYELATDKVCGEFLLTKLQTGQLNIAELDFSGIVKSIQEGDTTVQFDSGASDTDKIQLLINGLINGSEGDLVCYRKLKW